jgi:hypothetical protein
MEGPGIPWWVAIGFNESLKNMADFNKSFLFVNLKNRGVNYSSRKLLSK